MSDKLYTIEEVVRMLVYIKPFCTDIKKIYLRMRQLIIREKALREIKLKDEKKQAKLKRILAGIKILSQIKIERYKELVKDLEKIGASICDIEKGLIDVALVTENKIVPIFICIGANTTASTLFWHYANRKASTRKPYVFRK